MLVDPMNLVKNLIIQSLVVTGAILVLTSCGGGSGEGEGAAARQDIVRNFSSGAVPTNYTAVVHQPKNIIGAQIVVPPLSGQTAFQYFNQNIAQAISSNAALLMFPKGAYSIAPEGAVDYHVLISGGNDIVIDGQGSTLTFTGVLGGDATGLVQGFKLKGSSRVVLRNFIIDYDVRIASEGTVRPDAAHCKGVVHQSILIDTATYPMTDPRIRQAKIFNDSTDSLWGNRAHEYYTNQSPIDLQDGNAYYPCSSAFDHVFPVAGHRITVRHFAYDGNAVEVVGPDSQDITLENITIYKAPSVGIFFGNGFARGVAIENVKIVKNPADPAQLITLAADGLHFNNVGSDIVVENSEISFQGDDGLNIVSSMPSGTTVSGSRITIPNAVEGSFGLNDSKVGDVFSFYGADYSSLGSATLQSLTKGSDIVATFDALPGVTDGVRVLNQSQSTSRVYIAGNSFHDNRERGVITRSKGVWLENNIFNHNSGPALLLGTDGLHFMEGAFAQDVTIIKNTVVAANQTQVSPGTDTMEFGAVSLGIDCSAASGCGNTLSPDALIRNILIQDNDVSASAGIGMLLSNISSASVKGNRIADPDSAVLQSSFGGASSAAGSIHSTRSNGVDIGANTLSRAATVN